MTENIGMTIEMTKYGAFELRCFLNGHLRGYLIGFAARPQDINTLWQAHLNYLHRGYKDITNSQNW